jgi:hypothetical protein
MSATAGDEIVVRACTMQIRGAKGESIAGRDRVGRVRGQLFCIRIALVTLQSKDGDGSNRMVWMTNRAPAPSPETLADQLPPDPGRHRTTAYGRDPGAAG